MVISSFLLGIDYILLLKQLIYDKAKNNIIPKYLEISDDSDKEGKLRANYLKDTVLINTSKRAKHVPNPLCSYTLPRDLKTLKLASNSANPTKRPYPLDNSVHLTPKGYATIKHPDSNYVLK
ncbi:Di-copper centre-containing protein [Gigaspora margarita]|uniref:Di-copper centre-containing protein n=1 Tax=Gigaspora margarita TaxID=4874 RepID=A0A8H4B3Z4_GIGMA|nr:Di-copper centre-containing protein [Gigaspora margarita]